MFYRDLPQLTFFSDADLLEIEELSCGLSQDEVLEYYALTLEDVRSADTPDYKYFVIAFKRGRTKYKNQAVKCLFVNMAERNGAAASIAYLKRFGSEWPQEDGEDSSLSNKKFSFNVTMNDSL